MVHIILIHFQLLDIEDNGLVENLLLSLQIDGTYKAYLVTYDLTEDEKLQIQNNENIDLSDKTTFTTLQDQEWASSLFARIGDNGICHEWITITPRCTFGGEHSAEDRETGNNGGFQCAANFVAEPYTISSFTECGNGGGGSFNPTAPTGPLYDDYGNPYSNLGGGNNGGSTGTNPDPDDNNNDGNSNDGSQSENDDCLQADANGNCPGDLTTVIIRGNDDNEPDCEEQKQRLLNLVNNQTINSHINSLKDGIFSDSVNNYKEDGVRFAKTGINQYTPRYPNERLNNGLDYTPDYQSNETVSIHIHQQKYWDIAISPNPFFNAPVPSDRDIIELLENVKYINNTNSNLASDVTQIVMTEAGVFALVIDTQSAINTLTALENSEVLEKFKKKFDKDVLRKWNKINQNAGETCDANCLEDTANKFKSFVKNNKIAGSKLKAKVLQAVIDENDQITDWICN